MRDGYWQQAVCGGCGTTDRHADGCEGGGWTTRELARAEGIASNHLAGNHIGASDLVRSECRDCQRYGPTGAEAVCESCGAGYVRVNLVDADPDNVHGFKWLCRDCEERT
jgi:hypothetical protein